jgi:hypothetical protein
LGELSDFDSGVQLLLESAQVRFDIVGRLPSLKTILLTRGFLLRLFAGRVVDLIQFVVMVWFAFGHKRDQMSRTTSLSVIRVLFSMIEGIIQMPLVERSDRGLDTLEHRPHVRKYFILKQRKAFDDCDHTIILSLVKAEAFVSFFKEMVNILLPATTPAF